MGDWLSRWYQRNHLGRWLMFERKHRLWESRYRMDEIIRADLDETCRLWFYRYAGD